ncbi:unnamed protein product [Lactuca saligna]|uniref:Plastid lipid-associated protein/fibrillin conserved domain-containing protein n=1 Tax=Lactuca saligna TaxID=75948 RepID=A0AA35YTB0_LACSI|nr:unnamed protein product [Lactuca saligna]
MEADYGKMSSTGYICKDKDVKPWVWESAIPLKGFTAFSELLPLLEVGTIPLLKVGKICLQISTTTLTIDNSIAFSTPFSTFTSTASANLEVKSPPRIQTVSFLTYLLKSFVDYIRPNEESICKSIVNLLVTCSDFVSIRKVEPIFEKGVDLPSMDEANILLVNECESISHRICELISLDGEKDQKTSSYPNIPNDFFEEMESSWKNRVKKIHLKESYEEVDKAVEALSLAAARDARPLKEAKDKLEK